MQSLLKFAAPLLLVCSASTMAAPITLNFLVTATSGTLAGTTADGTVTYEDPATPSYSTTAANLITHLDFTWDGVHFDETAVTSGWLTTNALGELWSLGFGTSCFPGGCGTPSGSADWFIALGGGDHRFNYRDAVSGLSGSGNARLIVESEPDPESVPEPESALLMGLCVALLGISRRLKS